MKQELAGDMDIAADEGWLICRQDVFAHETKYYLTDSPGDTPLTTFVWVASTCWPIEYCIEESRNEFGLGDYQLCS